MGKLILEQETHRILGACFEVYKEKGCGFVEPGQVQVFAFRVFRTTKERFHSFCEEI